jgi:hypothetical protein
MTAPPLCPWCDSQFRPRQTGGRAQRFCRPSCRRAFHAAARNWALGAIVNGALGVEDIRNSAPATRALRRGGGTAGPGLDTRSPSHACPYPLARFLVEVPKSTIEAFVRFGFIASDQQDDLAAIIGALRRLGQAPAVSRIA